MLLKRILILFVLIFYFGCNNPTTPNFQSPINSYNGLWSVHLTGDINGSATFVVDEKGKIENGIPLNYIDSLEIITYVNDYIKDDGSFKSTFFCSKTIYSPNDVLILYSTSGNFVGNFKDSTGKGDYSITLNKLLPFSGTWSAVKIKNK